MKIPLELHKRRPLRFHLLFFLGRYWLLLGLGRLGNLLGSKLNLEGSYRRWSDETLDYDINTSQLEIVSLDIVLWGLEVRGDGSEPEDYMGGVQLTIGVN